MFIHLFSTLSTVCMQLTVAITAPLSVNVRRAVILKLNRREKSICFFSIVFVFFWCHLLNFLCMDLLCCLSLLLRLDLLRFLYNCGYFIGKQLTIQFFTVF